PISFLGAIAATSRPTGFGVIVGAITPIVRVARMPGTDETAVVAVIAAGRELAEAAIAAWDAHEAILPIDPGAPRAARDRLLDQLRPTHVAGADGRRARSDGVPAPADTAAVVVTSGTTGEPKGVELTGTGMEVMGRGYAAGLEADAHDRWLTCLPLHHV